MSRVRITSVNFIKVKDSFKDKSPKLCSVALREFFVVELHTCGPVFLGGCDKSYQSKCGLLCKLVSVIYRKVAP